jgi:hypothetical protein
MFIMLGAFEVYGWDLKAKKTVEGHEKVPCTRKSIEECWES